MEIDQTVLEMLLGQVNLRVARIQVRKLFHLLQLRIQDNSQLFDLKILLSLVSCMILYRIFLRDLLCISCDPKADRDSDGPINFLIKNLIWANDFYSNWIFRVCPGICKEGHWRRTKEDADKRTLSLDQAACQIIPSQQDADNGVLEVHSRCATMAWLACNTLPVRKGNGASENFWVRIAD